MTEFPFSMGSERLARLLAGDEGVWAEFTGSLSGLIERIAHRILGDRNLAEDVRQEAFLSLRDSLPRYDIGRPFPPWFFTIVNRVCLKQLRSIPRERPAPIPDRAAPITSNVESDRVIRQLAFLSPRDRFLLVARFLEERSNQEIGDDLQISKVAVGVGIHRALERLRERVKV